MKRTSYFAAVVCCSTLLILSESQGIDRTRTKGNVQPKVTPNQFDPSHLPGQEGLGNLGASADPFLPSGIYNPFPTLPGNAPAPNVVPNPQPGTYPPSENNNVRIRVQDPTHNYVPPGQEPPSQNRWRLGVLSRDTEQGVKIHEIVRGSAAERAGLEVNDLIVNVHGYQVGIVDGTLFELSREFERHADQNGMVTMLVQDHRSMSLMNLSVQLDSRFSRVNGNLMLGNSAQIPRGAKIIVELQEIVRQGAPPLTIARKEIENPRNYPVPFQLEYDPAQVSHRGEYVLTANLIDRGRPTYKTIQSFRVNSQGYGDGRPLAMRLEPVRPNYDNVAYQIDENASIATIAKWFDQYLGRPPSNREMEVWLSALQRGYTLKQVQLELLGHNQFFNRCDRDKETYVKRVHQLLIGEEPSRQELSYWLGRYDALGGIRRDIASEFQDAVGIR